ncbi:MAG TPA: helix-turn-helix transcriptional regulator [Steroidobacteraceae bacterium]|nr:helix-turn-helix transcriptional regulator [Steroidobacteraceae bacterium]
MTNSAILVRGIKARLKVQGISYTELATLIGVSVPTVKRDLSRGKFSLERLDQICEVLGVGVADLVIPDEPVALTMLTNAQEQALVAEPKLLLLTYLVVNDWKFDQIVNAFNLNASQLIHFLLKLDKLRIVDFKPPSRIRKLTARNFTWRKEGPVHRYFVDRVVPEFFDASFEKEGDEFQFMGGTLSKSSLLRMQASLIRLASEFEQFARHDAKLPLEQRHGCTAILALRSWEFSEFSRLRRKGR